MTTNLNMVGGDDLVKENKRLSQLIKKVEEQADEQRAKYDMSKAQISDLEEKLRVAEGKADYYKLQVP